MMKVISFLDQHPGLYYLIAIILLAGIFPSLWKFGKNLILYFLYSRSPIQLMFYNKARNKQTKEYYFITPIITIYNRHPFKKIPIAGIKMLNRFANPFNPSELAELTSKSFIVTNENGKELEFPFFLDTRTKYLVRFDPKTLFVADGWQILKQADVLPQDNILVELFYTIGDKLSFRLSDIEVKYED